MKYLDKQQFEIYVYHLIDQNNDEESHSRDFFAHHSDIYRTISLNIGWQRIGEQVRDDQIDVMIFPELGLDPIFNLLTTYRLAPIQCTTWAHPVTSGIPAIDYFISSELMEPENGDEHYSETLIRLPNLAFALPPLDTSDINGTRSDFNLEENVIIYWCCQSLFKYLPQHDYIFARIVQNNINFRLVFVAPPQGKVITDNFAKRLEKTFTKYGLNYQDYCIFLPRLNNQDFIKINLLADVFLDGLSWSGGLTTRQAIACNLPVVTCPGEFMRSRHSYAYLKMIGVTETIASNEEDYIQIAVRLGQDADWRQTIRNKTMDNKHRLFDDQECVLGLEHFLKQAVQDYNLKLNHGI
ncbi:O-linked N-acetylglucosamine transferase, SPINDLY family protein [Synechocystis salina]|uniref:O-linked N-acetylglucosamine transferase, SPINDLY family protein n=1 Tax=Synechocystis salina TaxID=945780 RepID=UPI002AD59DA4|nr:hypothetical protein [Synechocystis salina]